EAAQQELSYPREPGKEEEREQPGKCGQAALDEQVRERIADRQREQRDQHAEPILTPIEGLPMLGADQDRQERVRILQGVDAPEIDRGRGERARTRDQEPGASSFAVSRHRSAAAVMSSIERSDRGQLPNACPNACREDWA